MKGGILNHSLSIGTLRTSEQLETIRVRAEKGEDALKLLDERWDSLLMRQSMPNPTLLALWLREMAGWGQGIPFIITVESGDRFLAGGAFSIISPAGRLGPKLVTWLGRNGRPVQTPDLLVDPDFANAGHLLVDALFKEVHGVLVGPTPLNGSTSIFLRAGAPWLHIRPELEGWYTMLPPLALGRMQKEVAYQVRRATRLGATISVSVCKDFDAVAAALERLFVLHQERWKARNDESYFSTTHEQRVWHRRAVAALAARGAVRIVEVFEDGKLVASSLGLIAGRGAVFHTTATRVESRLTGPGHVALLTLVEEATRTGAEVLNLGLGGGNPGGPKSKLEPTKVLYGSFQAARSRALQIPLETILKIRSKYGVLNVVRHSNMQYVALQMTSGSLAKMAFVR